MKGVDPVPAADGRDTEGGRATGSRPEELRSEIEQTRDDLAYDVDRLADHTVPSRVVGRKLAGVRERTRSVADRVMGARGLRTRLDAGHRFGCRRQGPGCRGQGRREGTGDGAEHRRDRTRDAGRSGPEDPRQPARSRCHRVRCVGLLVASLLPRPRPRSAPVRRWPTRPRAWSTRPARPGATWPASLPTPPRTLPDRPRTPPGGRRPHRGAGEGVRPLHSGADHARGELGPRDGPRTVRWSWSTPGRSAGRISFEDDLPCDVRATALIRACVKTTLPAAIEGRGRRLTSCVVSRGARF
jgi:hypothetical protein